MQDQKKILDQHKDRTSVFDKKPYKNLMLTVALILLVSFVITLVNQISQLVFLASQVHPVFGQVLLWFFIL